MPIGEVENQTSLESDDKNLISTQVDTSNSVSKLKGKDVSSRYGVKTKFSVTVLDKSGKVFKGVGNN